MLCSRLRLLCIRGINPCMIDMPLLEWQTPALKTRGDGFFIVDHPFYSLFSSMHSVPQTVPMKDKPKNYDKRVSPTTPDSLDLQAQPPPFYAIIENCNDTNMISCIGIRGFFCQSLNFDIWVIGFLYSM